MLATLPKTEHRKYIAEDIIFEANNDRMFMEHIITRRTCAKINKIMLKQRNATWSCHLVSLDS